MKRYYGGDLVPGGLYLNQRTLEFSQISANNPSLPEPVGEKYIRCPALAGIILGPVFGLIFIMLLPLIGIAGILFFTAYKAGLSRSNLGQKVFQAIKVRF